MTTVIRTLVPSPTNSCEKSSVQFITKLSLSNVKTTVYLIKKSSVDTYTPCKPLADRLSKSKFDSQSPHSKGWSTFQKLTMKIAYLWLI